MSATSSGGSAEREKSETLSLVLNISALEEFLKVIKPGTISSDDIRKILYTISPIQSPKTTFEIMRRIRDEQKQPTKDELNALKKIFSSLFIFVNGHGSGLEPETRSKLLPILRKMFERVDTSFVRAGEPTLMKKENKEVKPPNAFWDLVYSIFPDIAPFVRKTPPEYDEWDQDKKVEYWKKVYDLVVNLVITHYIDETINDSNLSVNFQMSDPLSAQHHYHSTPYTIHQLLYEQATLSVAGAELVAIKDYIDSAGGLKQAARAIAKVYKLGSQIQKVNAGGAISDLKPFYPMTESDEVRANVIDLYAMSGLSEGWKIFRPIRLKPLSDVSQASSIFEAVVLPPNGKQSDESMIYYLDETYKMVMRLSRGSGSLVVRLPLEGFGHEIRALTNCYPRHGDFDPEQFPSREIKIDVSLPTRLYPNMSGLPDEKPQIEAMFAYMKRVMRRRGKDETFASYGVISAMLLNEIFQEAPRQDRVFTIAFDKIMGSKSKAEIERQTGIRGREAYLSWREAIMDFCILSGRTLPDLSDLDSIAKLGVDAVDPSKPYSDQELLIALIDRFTKEGIIQAMFEEYVEWEGARTTYAQKLIYQGKADIKTTGVSGNAKASNAFTYAKKGYVDGDNEHPFSKRVIGAINETFLGVLEYFHDRDQGGVVESLRSVAVREGVTGIARVLSKYTAASMAYNTHLAQALGVFEATPDGIDIVKHDLRNASKADIGKMEASVVNKELVQRLLSLINHFWKYFAVRDLGFSEYKAGEKLNQDWIILRFKDKKGRQKEYKIKLAPILPVDSRVLNQVVDPKLIRDGVEFRFISTKPQRPQEFEMTGLDDLECIFSPDVAKDLGYQDHGKGRRISVDTYAKMIVLRHCFRVSLWLGMGLGAGAQIADKDLVVIGSVFSEQIRRRWEEGYFTRGIMTRAGAAMAKALSQKVLRSVHSMISQLVTVESLGIDGADIMNHETFLGIMAANGHQITAEDLSHTFGELEKMLTGS